jgi:hypothetical protein
MKLRRPCSAERLKALGNLLSRRTGGNLDGNEGKESIRLKVVKGMEDLPWELLPLGDKPVGLAKPFQRRREEPDEPRNKAYAEHGGLSLLSVFTENPYPELPSLDMERKTLGDILTKEDSKIVYKPWKIANGIEKLKEKIRSCEIVHFGGHVDIDKGFQLNGETDDWVSLKEIFPQNAPVAPRFVWLNVCGHGHGVIHALLDSGCRNVLASNTEVTDRNAENGVGEFYRNLRAGKTIRDAVFDLRRTLDRYKDPSWISFIAYGSGEAIFKGIPQSP